jgi:hypothetical protein
MEFLDFEVFSTLGITSQTVEANLFAEVTLSQNDYIFILASSSSSAPGPSVTMAWSRLYIETSGYINTTSPPLASSIDFTIMKGLATSGSDPGRTTVYWKANLMPRNSGNAPFGSSFSTPFIYGASSGSFTF